MRILNLKTVLIVSLLIVGLVACSKDEDSIAASDISNIQSTPKPGQIALTWTVDNPDNLEYVKISYFDKLSKTNMVRLASIYADTTFLPNTRAKYGDYEITLQPFSPTNTGGKIYELAARSGVALADTTYTVEKLPLTVAMLASNAVEPSEGSLAGLLDNNTATFFHSAWSVAAPAVHNLQINLDAPIEKIMRFSYTTRSNGGTLPRNIVLYGSTDGSTWAEIERFTTLISGAAAVYTSPYIWLAESYQHFRMDVNSLDGGSRFFVMSEFSMWDITPIIVNPEAPSAND